ncbi:hypothetical protein B0H63DRAFT_473885 [Podospora didyma]|uniref:GST N-terminal domain-containing protein n=1 Tax=Podospora didyma TaxID=330526 RepID=A0AAE0U005_9PEZI|nr:hypothetical protein B0H63DRAFT_473885 [Podospora didyma]
MTPTFPKLTLYRADGSCALVPHMILRELGIPFTDVVMDFSPTTGLLQSVDGTLDFAAYQKIHPSGLVPALRIVENSSGNDDDDAEEGKSIVLTENPAIQMYIASLVPSSPIAGSTLLQRAQVLSWLNFLSGSVHGQGYGALWRPGRYIDVQSFPGSKEAVEAAGRRSIEKYYNMIETRLKDDAGAGGVRYALDDDRGGGDEHQQPTLVDFYLYLFFRWGNKIGIDAMKERFPNFTGIARAVEARESVKVVLAEEKAAFQFASSA